MAKKGGKRDGSKGKAIAAALSANPSATAKEVQAIVAKTGVDVSLGMIAKVKGQLKSSGSAPKKAGKKKAAKKKRAKKATVKKKTAGKKKGARRGRRPGGGPSMSDAIRAYMAANPNDGRAAVRDGLRAQGVDVKDSLVTQVYYKVKRDGGTPAKKRGPGRPKKKAAAKASAPAKSSGVSVDQLRDAKAIAQKFGGIDKVRSALAVLEELA